MPFAICATPLKTGVTYLGLRVVVGLVLAPDHWPPLVGVDEIAFVVAYDTGRARVDQGLDIGLLASLNHGPRALDIDLLEQRVGNLVIPLGGRRCGMDHDIGLRLLEDGLEPSRVGDVGLEVLDAVRVGPPVPSASQVDNGNGA